MTIVVSVGIVLLLVLANAIFDPSGLFGLVYWYALWPFHGYIFGGMLRNIVAAAHDLRA